MPMAWFTLLFGALLLGIGIGGQIFGTGRQAAGKPRLTNHPEDRRARRWVLTLGTLVVGLWFVAFSAVHLLHMHVSGTW
jgi:hypothetical protein